MCRFEHQVLANEMDRKDVKVMQITKRIGIGRSAYDKVVCSLSMYTKTVIQFLRTSAKELALMEYAKALRLEGAHNAKS